MPPVSAETFARLFGQLDGRVRREFLADLYAARGWEVRLDGDQLDVARGGEERRIAILDPPRFRATPLPDADEVVVTRDCDRVRSAAEVAGIGYRTPADLRELLLYGLDRESASALCRAYFDRPLSVDEPVDSGGGLSLTELSPSFAWNTRRVGVVAVLLLVIAVWVGSAGLLPALDSEDTVPELTRTYTPGQAGAIGGDQQYPPGLGPDGVENSGKLTIAHYEHLSGQSYVYRISASGPQHAPFMMGHTRWNATVRVQDATHYQYRKQAVAPHGFRVEQRYPEEGENVTVWVPRRPADVDNDSGPELLTKAVYADGTEKFWRYDGPEQVVYRRASVRQQGGRIFGIVDQIAWIDLYLQQFLWTETSSISCLSTTETRRCERYRVEATGEPVELRGEITEFSAVAIVEQSGFVRELTVRYRIASLENPDELAPVRLHLEYVSVGDGSDTVSPPEWLETAKNRTGVGDDPTATTETANETSTATP